MSKVPLQELLMLEELRQSFIRPAAQSIHHRLGECVEGNLQTPDKLFHVLPVEIEIDNITQRLKFVNRKYSASYNKRINCLMKLIA